MEEAPPDPREIDARVYPAVAAFHRLVEEGVITSFVLTVRLKDGQFLGVDRDETDRQMEAIAQKMRDEGTPAWYGVLPDKLVYQPGATEPAPAVATEPPHDDQWLRDFMAMPLPAEGSSPYFTGTPSPPGGHAATFEESQEMLKKMDADPNARFDIMNEPTPEEAKAIVEQIKAHQAEPIYVDGLDYTWPPKQALFLSYIEKVKQAAKDAGVEITINIENYKNPESVLDNRIPGFTAEQVATGRELRRMAKAVWKTIKLKKSKKSKKR